MSNVAQIVVPAPPDFTTTAQGAVTEGQAYALSMPSTATGSISVTNKLGHTFTWRPTELAYRDAANVLDYIVGSSPATVVASRREARYERLFPAADDVFLANAESVKHYTIVKEAPRSPAVYLGSGVEFGVSGVVGGVTLPVGSHETMDVDGFAFPRPFARDLEGNEVLGRYEVVDGNEGQQLFVWFPYEYFASAVYPVVIDPTVSTSTLSSATYTRGGRGLVILPSSGKYVMGYGEGTTLNIRYSTDNGQTWSTPAAGASISNVENGSWALAADAADHLYLAYKNSSSLNMLLRASTTTNPASITWTADSIVLTGNTGTYSLTAPAVIAHTEGAAWYCHAVYWRRDTSTTNCYAYHRPFSFDGSALTAGTEQTIYSNTTDAYYGYPAVDIDSAKNLRVGFAVAAGSFGVRYQRGLYGSGPAWTWDVGSTNVLGTTYGNDGVSVVCDDSGNTFIAFDRVTGSYCDVYKVDTALTVTDISPSPAFTVTGVAISRDSSGNPIIVYSNGAGIHWRMYSGGSWGAATSLTTAATAAFPDMSIRPFDSQIPIVWTEGSASPYNVMSGQISLNVAPSEPTITLGASTFAASVGTSVTIAHNDTDQMSAWALKRVYDTETRWWNNTTKAFDQTSEYFNAGSGFSVTIPAADNAGDWTVDRTYQLFAATKDSLNVVGPYNTTAVLANVGEKPIVTITSASTSNASQYTVEWTTDRAQSKYKVRVLNGATVVSDTGEVSSGTARARTVELATNSTTYTVEVTSWDTTPGGGVASGASTISVTTSFTIPNTAQNVTATGESASARIKVSWDRGITPAAGLGSATNQNDTFGGTWRVRRKSNDAPTWNIVADVANPDEGTRVDYYDYHVASGVTYEYRVDALGNNGTVAEGTPVSTSVTLVGVWIHDAATPSTTILSLRTVALQSSWEPEAATLRYAGRKTSVVQFGEQERVALTLDLLLLNTDAAYVSFETLVKRKTTLCVRDGYGRKVFGVILSLPVKDELWGGRVVPVEIVDVDYDEFVTV